MLPVVVVVIVTPSGVLCQQAVTMTITATTTTSGRSCQFRSRHEPERRYACWGSFGPPVISAQCPRGTVIQVLRAGLKVKHGTGPCVYQEDDCGCEYGQSACNMDRVRERCMGRPACRLDVTQQYINTPTCTGFSDYMYIEFNCVPMKTTSLHDICVTDVTVSKTGFIRSPNYPNKYPKNRYCLCNLRTLPEHSVKDDKDEHSLCSSKDDDMREFDTGRSSITVVMETDEVSSSGGFWLKYEASPEAMVQMECFGQFAKEDRNDSRKPKIVTVISDGRTSVIGRDSSPFTNQNSSDISNESIIQSTGTLVNRDDLIVKDISVTLKRLPNAVLSSDSHDGQSSDEAMVDNDAGETNKDVKETQNTEQLSETDTVILKSSSTNNQKESDKHRNTNAIQEPLNSVENDYPGITAAEFQNKNITDEDFDSIIQTILDQISAANDKSGDEVSPDDKAKEELLVNIAQLMVNELDDGRPAAEVAPAPGGDDLKTTDYDFAVPLEYDSLEELLARDRLENQIYDDIVDDINALNLDYGGNKMTLKTDQRSNGKRVASATPAVRPPPKTRKLPMNPNARRRNGRLFQNGNNEARKNRPANNQAKYIGGGLRSREDVGDEKPWWFKFTLKDRDRTEENRREKQPDANHSPTSIRNRGHRIDVEKLYSRIRAERERGRERERKHHADDVPLAPSEEARSDHIAQSVLGDGPTPVENNNLALSIGSQPYPNPSQPRPNPAKDDRHLKGELRVHIFPERVSIPATRRASPFPRKRFRIKALNPSLPSFAPPNRPVFNPKPVRRSPVIKNQSFRTAALKSPKLTRFSLT
ncbi:hypothetical protein LSH36_133g01010 [Paralvinella palmiformis]|uniref:SUEL-type lectin domain-containing protein n=1 Tax=Paralvinella palmiformis TaxID=53620 RepID=A0AAD9JXC2_9ANNE|nr:hypothetical protein LSH36_133g01010 [Paralvinella palmiformis]